MRGFFAGVFWGGVFAVLGLGIASQLGPMPVTGTGAATPGEDAETTPDGGADAEAATAVEAAPDAQADAQVEAAPEAPVEPTPAPAPAAEPTATPEPAPSAAQPETAVGAALDPLMDAPAVEPDDATEPAAAEPAPEIVADAPRVDKPAPQDTAPEAATPAPAPEVATAAPEAPAAPAAVAEAPALPAANDDKPVPADPARPAAPGGDTAPEAGELPPPPPLTEEEQAMLAEPAPPADAAAPEPAAAPVPAEPAEPAPPEAEPNEAAPGTATMIEPDGESSLTEGAEATLPPAPGLDEQVDGVTVGRLPSIGSDTDEAAAEGEAAPEAAPADLPPLARYARAFENPDAKPLFSVVLLDTGGPDLDRAALAELPFPVTFAIDPTAPDAATAAEVYRAAGQEVVMLATGIPAGAKASDLEVAFEAHAAALPEAVAVMDLEADGFQNDRPLATQVVPVVAGQGRGLITWDKGLNAGDQVARREGVASALIFRRIDAEGEDAAVIRRSLDRAAFKAAQDGRVTVVGSTRPETVAALLEWTVEGRAATVALAPVTAVLAAP